jgi:hypothetical protein
MEDNVMRIYNIVTIAGIFSYQSAANRGRFRSFTTDATDFIQGYVSFA